MNAGRNVWISLRLTPEEKERIASQAKQQGMSTGDYLRKMLQMQRVRKTNREREKLLQLARIGNNLNQLARWAKRKGQHAANAAGGLSGRRRDSLH